MALIPAVDGEEDFLLAEDEWVLAREDGHFDYIVVGSGFCALAFVERTLRRDPWAKILIIERGPFVLRKHLQSIPDSRQRDVATHLVETLPWTVSPRMASQPRGGIRSQRGMLAGFGGRSVVWSAWCPSPTRDEMAGWPEEVIRAAETHLASAAELLNVVSADAIDADFHSDANTYPAHSRPIFSSLQVTIQNAMAQNLVQIPSATSSMPAPLALAKGAANFESLARFSVPEALLGLAAHQRLLARAGAGRELRMVTGCVVTRISEEQGRATNIETSHGVVNVGTAKLILAMGAVPPATLVLNSFPHVETAGGRLTAHFISLVVARVPVTDYVFPEGLRELEAAAVYLSGSTQGWSQAENRMHYHLQLSAICDQNPEGNATKTAGYLPDVVLTESRSRPLASKDHVTFGCAALGEIDFRNPENALSPNGGADPTSNVTLQILANDRDRQTWNTMDDAIFASLELALSPKGPSSVEYWHGDAENGSWKRERPSIIERRVAGLVHEGSTLWIGTDPRSPVGLDYRPRGVENVYVTGGSLWPTAGSWNPTLTMVALAQDLADNFGPCSSDSGGSLRPEERPAEGTLCRPNELGRSPA